MAASALHDIRVNIRLRYIGWARFVLRVASMLERLHCPHLVLRLVMCACWMQIRCEAPKITVTRWQWMRVPFPKVSK